MLFLSVGLPDSDRPSLCSCFTLAKASLSLAHEGLEQMSITF